MFRTTRAPAAFAALLGLVLGLLVWGAPARAEQPGGSAAAVDSAVAVAVVVSAPGAAVPGCDPGRPAAEGAGKPLVPPRAHGFAELLPALAADRVAGGDRPVGAAGREPAPVRERPVRVPPSPVELSVLRV